LALGRVVGGSVGMVVVGGVRCAVVGMADWHGWKARW
jgi:hypothetical protein